MKRHICILILAVLMPPLVLSIPACAAMYYYGFNAGCDGGRIYSGHTGSFAQYGNTPARLQPGCLVQFIYAGLDEYISPPSQDGGVTGDDVLLLSGAVGSDEVYGNIASREGEFWYAYSGTVEAVLPPKVYIRVWSTYEVDIQKGSYYGQSIMFSPEYLPTPPVDYAVPTLEVSFIFDKIPPEIPESFIATAESSGAIILTWKSKEGPDVVGTRIVYRTDRYPTQETDGIILTEVATLAAQAYRHTGLTEGMKYYYGAFSFDRSSNYSAPAVTSGESHDIVQPVVVSTAPTSGEANVSLSSSIVVQYNENMSQESAEKSFHISPSTEGLIIWPLGSREVFDPIFDLMPATTYVCTIDTSARDLAGNPIASSFTWTFRTIIGSPPIISDLKIGGFKLVPGDTISQQPKINAYITDPDYPPPLCGIVTIEILAGSTSYLYSSPEIYSIYNRISGYLDVRLKKDFTPGTYTIALRAWDTDGNLTEESVSGLQVKGGAVKLDSPVMSYPYQFESGAGTTIAYELAVDSTVWIHVYSVKGLVYSAQYFAGSKGGTAGYNEIFWDGLNGNGAKLGNGIYIIKILDANKQPLNGGTSRIVIKN